METSVLIVEDSDTVRGEIIEVLKQQSLFGTYHEAQDGLQGLRILFEKKVDLILCDLQMPRMDGFKFTAMVQKREELRGIPILLLTGVEDPESKIKGLEQGASDYITKPFDPGELIARVKVHLKIKTLQDQLKSANELLVEISHTDHLTGLYNRRYVVDMLDKEFIRAKRKGRSISILLMDLDHFKQVNDVYGHQAGDSVLKETATMFRGGLRCYDTAARYGGEEFIALIPDSSPTEAVGIAERIREAIEKRVFYWEAASIHVTASLGVATYPMSIVGSVNELVRESDNALYRAKKKGRNRVECAPYGDS
jgi:diguanylate cyclase (GGDEF)-like protein